MISLNKVHVVFRMSQTSYPKYGQHLGISGISQISQTGISKWFQLQLAQSYHYFSQFAQLPQTGHVRQFSDSCLKYIWELSLTVPSVISDSYLSRLSQAGTSDSFLSYLIQFFQWSQPVISDSLLSYLIQLFQTGISNRYLRLILDNSYSFFLFISELSQL